MEHFASSHVAHDCIVGDSFVLAQMPHLWSLQVADNVYFGAYSAAHQFVRIGNAMIGGLTAVIADIIPYGNVFGERGHLQGLSSWHETSRHGKIDIKFIKSAFDHVFLQDGVFQDNSPLPKQNSAIIKLSKR